MMNERSGSCRPGEERWPAEETAAAAEARGQRPSFVQVDLAAIGRNAKKYKELLAEEPGCRLMAVVKANAYGHGALPVAREALAAGAHWLGVALPQEAFELRQGGIQAPILILGYSDPAAYEGLIKENVSITIFSPEQGRALAEAAAAIGHKALVHLKIDTGMSRIGFCPGEAALKDIVALAALGGLELEGCFTHFARADEDDEASWRQQREAFEDFLAALAAKGLSFPLVHCANTAAIMRGGAAGMNMCRLGIGLYGLYPSPAAKSWGLGLEPALSWKSCLSHVKWLPPGKGVSYGHIWRTERETLVGTVPLGYADGYPRSLSNKGRVLVGGKSVPVIGRICMDQFMVDLTAVPQARPGDEVVLIGRQDAEEISVDDLAGLVNTINYEVVCMIGGRIPRRYI